MTDIFFLKASAPLTKSYKRLNPQELIKTPYPFVWEFTSIRESVLSLAQLEPLLKSHAAKGHCVLKGVINKPLVNETRAGSTNTIDNTEWLVLDLDGLPDTLNVATPGGQSTSTPLTIDLFLGELGLQDISYIVQWSASYGISDQRIRAHVIMMLDKGYAAPLLKQWLIQKNHEVPLLREAMTLTKTCNTLSWPLDISACQNDKLIYIAPPVLKGIKDPMGKQPRITLVKRKYDVLALSALINSTEKNRKLTTARINELRKAAGIEERKITFKQIGSHEVMVKPDSSVVTEMKTERGFVYFNLNGGDSWAYYHPENNPDYVLNFKGEPVYQTKDLLPDYWSSICGTNTRTSSTGVTYLAFCDRRTGVYWRGTYDAGTDVLDILPAKNETQLRHFAKQYGVSLGDFVPEWDIVFDPNDNVRIDAQNKIVNRFSPSVYMKQQVRKTVQCPPTIFKVMHHALGSDVDITEHFTNWLAYALQKRDRTKTAWVMHGTTGTGKGILTNNILKPLFGNHTATRRMEELSDKYNHFMADSLLVFVDEVQIKALGGEKGIMAKLKNFITEETVAIRSMYQNATEQRNYTCWIFMSNMPDPVLIEKNDRRFNIAKYQTLKLIVTDQELALVEKELQAFHDYLMTYAVDELAVRTVMQTDDRTTLISISESSIDTATTALIEGDFNFFLDQLPTDNSHLRNALTSSRVEDYKEVLKNILDRSMKNLATPNVTMSKGGCGVARDEIRTLLDYVVGNMPQSPNKLISLLKHHRIHMAPVWVAPKTVKGLYIAWKDLAQFPQYLTAHFPQPKKAKTP